MIMVEISAGHPHIFQIMDGYMERDYFREMEQRVQVVKELERQVQGRMDWERGFPVIRGGYRRAGIVEYEPGRLQGRIRDTCHCIDAGIAVVGVAAVAVFIWGLCL